VQRRAEHGATDPAEPIDSYACHLGPLDLVGVVWSANVWKAAVSGPSALLRASTSV